MNLIILNQVNFFYRFSFTILQYNPILFPSVSLQIHYSYLSISKLMLQSDDLIHVYNIYIKKHWLGDLNLSCQPMAPVGRHPQTESGINSSAVVEPAEFSLARPRQDKTVPGPGFIGPLGFWALPAQSPHKVCFLKTHFLKIRLAIQLIQI